MTRLSKLSTNESILAVLRETADAVSIVLRANKDWSLSGLRDTQYSVDLRADAAALEVCMVLAWLCCPKKVKSLARLEMMTFAS